MPLLIKVGRRGCAFQECLGTGRDPSGKRMDLLLRKPWLRAQQVTLSLLFILLLWSIILIKQCVGIYALPGIESKHFFILANFKDLPSYSHLLNLTVTLVSCMKSLYSLHLCCFFASSPSLAKFCDY